MREIIVSTYLSLTLLAVLFSFSVDAFSSPWAPASWRLTLNIGRESSCNMPDEWGASGARLVLPIDIEIESSPSKRRDSILGNGGSLLKPKSSATYITNEGQQMATFNEGAWKIELPAGKKGYASKLDFWIELKDSVQRNDVGLEKSERIYFTANCWREEELEIGSRKIAPILTEYKEAQRILEKQVAHETGDRRLDGTEMLETIAAYKDMTELTLRRDEKLRKLRKAEEVYPRDADELSQGPWPGQEEFLSIAPKSMTVKRSKIWGDEVLSIGTWSIEPLGLEDE